MLAEDVSIIQAEMVKRNIQYRVVRVDRSGTVADEVMRMVLRLEKRMKDD